MNVKYHVKKALLLNHLPTCFSFNVQCYFCKSSTPFGISFLLKYSTRPKNCSPFFQKLAGRKFFYHQPAQSNVYQNISFWFKKKDKKTKKQKKLKKKREYWVMNFSWFGKSSWRYIFVYHFIVYICLFVAAILL